MNIETVDDILDELADRMGVYGACKSDSNVECNAESVLCCRVGFMIEYHNRIYKAIENEEKLHSVGIS